MLPTDDKARKELPVFRGPLMYFPDAIAEVARVCKVGNDQHNHGEPMHWARDKSTEHLDTALRHMIDHGTGNVMDVDGTYHLAKAAWRLLAELQTTIERERGRHETIVAVQVDRPSYREDLAKFEAQREAERKVDDEKGPARHFDVTDVEAEKKWFAENPEWPRGVLS